MDAWISHDRLLILLCFTEEYLCILCLKKALLKSTYAITLAFGAVSETLHYSVSISLHRDLSCFNLQVFSAPLTRSFFVCCFLVPGPFPQAVSHARAQHSCRAWLDGPSVGCVGG